MSGHDYSLAFRRLLSGEQQGPSATLARGLLWCAQPAYSAAITLRNAYYSNVPTAVHRVALPVMSVGNLTVGGTGKTPMVAYVANWLHQRNRRVAIVSRGYRANADGRNDESHELAVQVPDALHLQDPDRVAAARKIASQHLADVIVLDDGFQHRRLHRDIDLLLIDALQPDGWGYLLPRGLLREPVSAVRRADVIALTRSDAIAPTERAQLRDQFRRVAPDACWTEFVHRPVSLVNSNGEVRPVASLADQTVAAFCGIGNPDGFRFSLQQLRLKTSLFRDFPDHFDYPPSALDEWEQAIAARPAVTAVVCTGKDLIKIPRAQLADRPLWAVRIEMELVHGGDEFERRLSAVLGGNSDHCPLSAPRI